MFKRRCPYCHEKIQREAKVCRFCGREIEPLPSFGGTPWVWLLFGFVGAFLGAGAMIGYQVLKERRIWSGQEKLPLPSKTSRELEEQLMDF